MKTLPRILIIDDVLGKSDNGYNTYREDFCLYTGIKDITDDCFNNEIDKFTDEFIAETIFCSGQIAINGNMENNIEKTLEIIRRGWEKYPRWALLIIDMCFKTGKIYSDGTVEGRKEDYNPNKYFGLKILEYLSNDSELQNIPIIILSSMDRDIIENRFANLGIFDFINKTELNQEKIKNLLIKYALIEDENQKIIGRSISLINCLREARIRAFWRNDNILILGEPGTGKELLAQYIHNQPMQVNKKLGEYIILFIQGKPDNLIEDELFGHIKGAYTGAITNKAGAAELANRGTLFIDEFGNIPKFMQKKLIRLLDLNIREVQRIGDKKWIKVDLQVIMATNCLDIAYNGDFNQDILDRIRAKHPIILPPLRERIDDIPLLTEFFVRKYERLYQAKYRKIPEETLEVLKKYNWLGNIRELESVINNAIQKYAGLKSLSIKHLNFNESISISLTSSNKSHQIESEPILTEPQTIEDTDVLMTILENFDFDSIKPEQLVGKLTEMQKVWAKFIARYLKAALETTKKHTPENPALKLITGDSKLSALKAADIIKRLFRIAPEIKKDILTDPVLNEAYNNAIRLRPKKKTK